eukprot:9219453-Alexandrium_andersonii.AAC.1
MGRSRPASSPARARSGRARTPRRRSASSCGRSGWSSTRRASWWSAAPWSPSTPRWPRRA